LTGRLHDIIIYIGQVKETLKEKARLESQLKLYKIMEQNESTSKRMMASYYKKEPPPYGEKG